MSSLSRVDLIDRAQGDTSSIDTMLPATILLALIVLVAVLQIQGERNRVGGNTLSDGLDTIPFAELPPAVADGQNVARRVLLTPQPHPELIDSPVRVALARSVCRTCRAIARSDNRSRFVSLV